MARIENVTITNMCMVFDGSKVLDSMSIDIRTNKYYSDLPTDKLEQVAVEDGFLLFFQKALNFN